MESIEIATILSVPFCQYHFVRTILSVPFCQIPFCPVTRMRSQPFTALFPIVWPLARNVDTPMIAKCLFVSGTCEEAPALAGVGQRHRRCRHCSSSLRSFSRLSVQLNTRSAPAQHPSSPKYVDRALPDSDDITAKGLSVFIAQSNKMLNCRKRTERDRDRDGDNDKQANRQRVLEFRQCR